MGQTEQQITHCKKKRRKLTYETHVVVGKEQAVKIPTRLKNIDSFINGVRAGELDGQSSRMSDSCYRRGISQALSLAADLVAEDCDYDDFCWLCDESMKMRCDCKEYPAYIDELRKRFCEYKKANKAGGLERSVPIIAGQPPLDHDVNNGTLSESFINEV